MREVYTFMRNYTGVPQIQWKMSLTLIAVLIVSILVLPSLILANDAGKPAHFEISELTTSLQDMEATVHVSQADVKELEKIGKDFGTSYRFRKLTFQYKQPNKLRLEAHSSILGLALLVLNGPLRSYSVPKLHLHSTENLLKSPAKRQTILEYGGLVSADTLQLMNSKFLRSEILDGENLNLYELKYQGVSSGSYYVLWMDPKTRITVKREWFDSDKKLRATFNYSDPHEIEPGIWIPYHVDIKNAEGILAASTTLNDVKINQSLPDTLFEAAP